MNFWTRGRNRVNGGCRRKLQVTKVTCYVDHKTVYVSNNVYLTNTCLFNVLFHTKLASYIFLLLWSRCTSEISFFFFFFFTFSMTPPSAVRKFHLVGANHILRCGFLVSYREKAYGGLTGQWGRLYQIIKQNEGLLE